jgi:threonyl-tRNA synthetase
MVHRTVYGSLERFIGILTEHFAGAFPLWFAPVQAKVLTITERSGDAAKEAVAALKKAGVRAEYDIRNEKIGYKIRQAQMEKVPYMLVIGDKEAQDNLVSVRKRGVGEIGTMALSDFIALAKKEINEKIIF